MKQVNLLLILLSAFVLTGLCACRHQPYPQAMQAADTLVYTNPDSALTLLAPLEENIAAEPRSTQMYYRLLCIKAQDKAYITHTSDSLILQVIRYYEKKHDRKHLPEAYYYGGRVYRDLGDAPQALEYFQHAKDAAAEGSTDYKLMSLIYSQMGMLFLYQDIYDKAPEMFRKAYHYSSLAKDDKGMVFRLRDIARSFNTLNQTDSALHYYMAADEQAVRINNSYLRSIVNSELSGYYAELGIYKEAYKTMQIALLEEDRQNPPVCTTIAKYYEYTNQTDSATYYYNRLLLTNDYIYRQTAYEGLYRIARAKGKIKEMLTYLDQYLICSDSLQQMNQAETVRKVNALYGYQQGKQENRKLKIQAFREKRLKFLFGIAFLFSTVLFFAYWQYHKRREQAREVQRQKMERIKKEQEKQSLAQIEKNKQEIALLELSLKEAETTQNQLLQDLLRAQKELIEKSNEQIEAEQRMKDQAEIKLKETDIYKKFHNALPNDEEEPLEEIKITASDWQELGKAIDDTYNRFTARLKELHPLTDIELKVCLLLKIGVPPRQIADIVMRSRQAVSSIRKRLYKKLFNTEGSTEQLDNFVKGF